MASINGLSIKKLKYFQGMDGKMAQGDLYLGNKKIAFWSQDDCIEDNLDMEPGYSEYRLRQAIIAAHPEKHEEKIAQNGVPYTLDYGNIIIWNKSDLSKTITALSDYNVTIKRIHKSKEKMIEILFSANFKDSKKIDEIFTELSKLDIQFTMSFCKNTEKTKEFYTYENAGLVVLSSKEAILREKREIYGNEN